MLPEKSSCLNCEAEITPEHQCESTDSDSELDNVESESEKRLRLEERIRLLKEALRLYELEKDKTLECQNCGEVFVADHQCRLLNQ